MKIKYYNRKQLPTDVEAAYSATYCPSLHDLLSTSDVVSLNCPLNANTTNLISTPEFEAMKPDAVLINTSRGAVVDESALKTALNNGKLSAAGLDVFCDEPNADPELMNHEKVTMQPHLGGLTDVAFQRAERECFENIRAYFATGKPNSPVREVVQK